MHVNFIIGCVLAGGKSSRMGQNKALMIYQNQRLVDRASQLLIKSGVSQVLVSGKFDGLECVSDTTPNLGPVGGIVSVILSKKDVAGIVFIPVDMPLLTSDLIKKLIGNQSCCFENLPLPVFLKMSDQLLDFTKEVVRAGKAVAVKEFLSHLEIKKLPISEAEKNNLVNINNPKEWEELLCI